MNDWLLNAHADSNPVFPFRNQLCICVVGQQQSDVAFYSYNILGSYKNVTVMFSSAAVGNTVQGLGI